MGGIAQKQWGVPKERQQKTVLSNKEFNENSQN